MAYDFRRFEDLYPLWEARFRIGPGPGEFSYLPGGRPCVYGPCDMAMSRATIGALDPSPDEARAWAGVINGFQRASGWYRKAYTLHFRDHTTAYAVAALRLLGHGPERPVLAARRAARSRRAAEAWLRSVPWSLSWPGSHAATGIPAVLQMCGEGSDEFFDWYFEWLEREAEPSTGFWSRGLAHRLGILPKLSKEEMGGAFHMYYIYEARGRRWLYPERVVDAVLALQNRRGFWDGDSPYCIDLDGVYSAIRSSRDSGWYRKTEVIAACERFLSGAAALLNERESLFGLYPNSHKLPGALSAIAEVAKAFPELVVTARPWTQTLDLACYI